MHRPSLHQDRVVVYWYSHCMVPNSRGFHIALSVALAAGCAAISGAAMQRVRWEDVLRQPSAWYRSADARQIADNVLLYQRASGGWPKDIDMTVPPPDRTPPARSEATIDNGATTTQIRLLSRVDGPPYQAAALRGIDYLLAAQYPNGGWPQVYPLRNDYSRYITFNDNAMMNVMELLDEISSRTAPFAYVDQTRRQKARAAAERGVSVILRSQIEIEGILTAWCAQHDEITLEPRPARSFEHASLSGMETVAIVRFLMTRTSTPGITRAVDSAVAWLQRVRLADGRWARFYELGSDRPIFSGRDGAVRYSLEEIEQERREGYAWFGTWPRSLVEREYPLWRSRQG
jgi:PelA/Pel-15E family pectate lyase